MCLHQHEKMNTLLEESLELIAAVTRCATEAASDDQRTAAIGATREPRRMVLTAVRFATTPDEHSSLLIPDAPLTEDLIGMNLDDKDTSRLQYFTVSAVATMMRY